MSEIPTALKRTPARLRWLRDIDAGLVQLHTTHVTSWDGFDGDVLYPRHPQGRRADWWLCDEEVRKLWRPSRSGSRAYRIARLTMEGRRLLQGWASPETGV